jgi:Arc/MetJ-type ribon-helix-helix transcriptional regulator
MTYIKMPDKIQVMNVRVPKEVIKWIDSLVKANIYNSRSEAVRDFIREYVRDSRND